MITPRRFGAWNVFFSAPGDRASIEAAFAAEKSAGHTDKYTKIVPCGGTAMDAAPESIVWTFKVLA